LEFATLKLLKCKSHLIRTMSESNLSQRGKDNLVVRAMRALGREFGFKVNREEEYKKLADARKKEEMEAKVMKKLEDARPGFEKDGHGIRGPQNGQRRNNLEIVGADGKDEQMQVGRGGGRKAVEPVASTLMVGLNVNGAPGVYDSVGSGFRLI